MPYCMSELAAFKVLQTFEEIVDANLERLRQFPQTRRADPVRTTFIFLDLLKANAHSLGNRRLRQAQLRTPVAQARADMEVNRMCHPTPLPFNFSRNSPASSDILQ